MGSKLAVLAAQLSLAAGAHAQPAPQGPVDPVKPCLEAYKAQKYGEAAACLEKAYELVPKPETLFALAQAYRLDNKCDKAIPLYKKLLAQTTELAAAKAVQNNLALCPGGEPPPATEPRPEDKPEQAAPRIEWRTRTVVREVRKTDPLAIALLAGGALGGGFGVGMLLRASSTRDAAGDARTLDDANDLHDRADRDRLIGFIAGGAGVVALGFAVFRIATGGGESSTTEIAVTPTTGGSMMVLSKIW